MRVGFAGGRGRRRFYTAGGDARAVGSDPTVGTRGRGAGRRKAGGGGTFPAQAQVFGHEARVERRFGQMGRAEIVLGRKMSVGPNLICIFPGKL